MTETTDFGLDYTAGRTTGCFAPIMGILEVGP